MSHDRKITRLRRTETSVLVIDVQEKLLPLILQGDRVVSNIRFLIEIAKMMQVPVLATEQYPKGLGPTVPKLAEVLEKNLPSKVEFSCGNVPEVQLHLRESKRPNVLLVGIETNVCVLHTALDLMSQGFQVAVAVDAVSARYSLDHDLALKRMEHSGALLTTVETTAFEWVETAKSHHFKDVSRMVQDRYKQIGAVR